MNMVIYHGNCWDGFCAAWLAHQVWPEAEYVPAQYGQSPPDVSGKDVLIVDFSYKRDILFKMVGDSKSLTVLDHHKTAQADLVGFDIECASNNIGYPDITFDMDKSGGRLAWEYLYGRRLLPDWWLTTNRSGYSIAVAPWIVDYTEDRDLWRWKIANSRQVTAALRTYPLDFALWDSLHIEDRVIGRLHAEGEVIRRYETLLVDQHVSNAREIAMDGHKILAVNATVLFSDIAGTLAVGRPFGAAYFDRQDGKRQWSLRSTNDGVDVSEVAKNHCGGGHRNAAGFEEVVSIDGITLTEQRT